MGGCFSVEVVEEPAHKVSSRESALKKIDTSSNASSARTDVTSHPPSRSHSKEGRNGRSGETSLRRESSNVSEQSLDTPTTKKGASFKYRLSELRSATNHFNKKNVIGEGSFGEVFRGSLVDKGTGEQIPVAVKVLNHDSQQGMDEWLQEVVLLPNLAHPNLIRLVGYCSERGEACLVYDLCQNGSLEDRLFPASKSLALTWPQRVHIMRGTANALLHLHQHNVIHRDLKPANILLDASLDPKLTDFGMAKQGDDAMSHISTRVMGTLGYLDPAYMETGCLREKSDVYSFGVILLQILTGKDAFSEKNDNWRLVKFMHPKLHPVVTDPADWIDPMFEGNYSRKGALRMAAIAKRCVGEYPDDRPEMKDIVEHLNEIPDS